MPIDMSKIYAVGKKTDESLLKKFKTEVESAQFQDKVANILYGAASNGDKVCRLILIYKTTGNSGQNGELTVTLDGKTLIEIEASTIFVRSACNNNFMKFAEVLIKLFDESQMKYTVDEVNKFTPNFTRISNSPQINFTIKLREEE